MTRAFPIVLVVTTLAACDAGVNKGNGAAEESAGIEEGRSPAANAEEQSPAAVEADERELRITTVEDTLVAGVTAEIRMENLSDRTIGFNLCPKVLERRIGETWTQLPETRPEACTLELRILGAGETVVGTTGIPLALEAGTYRIVFEGIAFEQGDPQVPGVERTTNAFQID